MILTTRGHEISFYANNPFIGLPYIDVITGLHASDKVELVEGELQTRYPDGVGIKLHREGDTGDKNMTIEILP